MVDGPGYKVTLETEDQMSGPTKTATKSVKDMDKAQKDLKKSTVENDIAFLALTGAIDKVHSGMMKIIGAVGELNLVNDEQLQKLRQVAAAMDLIVGTTEVVIAIRHLDILSKLRHFQATNAQILSMGALAAAMGGVAFAMLAVSAETDEQKATYTALTAVTWGLAGAQLAVGIATTGASTFGLAVPAYVALMTAAFAGIAALVTATASGLVSAQTGPGEVKIVTRSGAISAHEGEFIHRGGRNRGGGDMHLHIQTVLDLDKPSNRRTVERMMRKAMRGT